MAECMHHNVAKGGSKSRLQTFFCCLSHAASRRSLSEMTSGCGSSAILLLTEGTVQTYQLLKREHEGERGGGANEKLLPFMEATSGIDVEI